MFQGVQIRALTSILKNFDSSRFEAPWFRKEETYLKSETFIGSNVGALGVRVVREIVEINLCSNSRWRTATKLEMVKALQISSRLFDIAEIWYAAAS